MHGGEVHEDDIQSSLQEELEEGKEADMSSSDEDDGLRGHQSQTVAFQQPPLSLSQPGHLKPDSDDQDGGGDTGEERVRDASDGGGDEENDDEFFDVETNIEGQSSPESS